MNASLNPVRPLKILLVEDSAMDTNLIQIALSRSHLNSKLTAFKDGEKAMSHLHENSQSEDRPDLTILDLNLPGMDGFDVLEQCKVDPQLKSIPIVVFTSTDLADEIGLCYELGADKVVTKPGDLGPF